MDIINCHTNQCISKRDAPARPFDIYGSAAIPKSHHFCRHQRTVHDPAVYSVRSVRRANIVFRGRTEQWIACVYIVGGCDSRINLYAGTAYGMHQPSSLYPRCARQ